MRRVLCALLTLAALWLAPRPVLAAGGERILSYGSRIVIGADADLTVTETITVQSAGAAIRHGLVREFPTRYRTADGRTVEVGFRVLSVRRDGRNEDYHVANAANGKKIYMGQKNVVLPPGRYTFELTYVTEGQIGQFPDYDELYWNVTGNDWRLPIEAATASVILPPGAKAGNYTAYTGPAGAKNQDYTARDNGNVVVFAATVPLPPGQGLTVAVSFPKGFVQPPSPAVRLLTNRATLTAFGGLVCVAVYFVWMWFQVGRDPRPATIVPLFAPPPEVSAPGARYLRRMGFDDKTFAAGLVDMAVSGGIVIEEPDDVYIVARGKKSFEPGTWQRGVIDALIGPGGALRLEQENHTVIAAARKSLEKSLAERYENRLFHTNALPFWIGAALAVAVMALTAWVADDRETAAMFVVWLGTWSFGVAMLTIRALAALSRARARPGFRSVTAAIAMTLFAVPFWIGEAVGVAFFSLAVSIPAAAALAVIAVLVAVFRWLLKAPTLEGRRVLDALEGFRLYLSVGEAERLNLLNPPDRTPELFERYLPYALALDVEVAWAAQFADVLARAEAAGYAPAWYVGHSWHSGDFSGFAGGLGDGFSASISSAATAPGSTSGSGGGGSSGGGGGGGGGGGW